MTMKTNLTINGYEIPIGSEVKINGRIYTVKSNVGVGENTRRECQIAAQYGIEGQRGSMAMMILFNNGMGRLVFTTARRVESFVQAAVEITFTEVIGYTLPVDAILAACN